MKPGQQPDTWSGACHAQARVGRHSLRNARTTEIQYSRRPFRLQPLEASPGFKPDRPGTKAGHFASPGPQTTRIRSRHISRTVS